MGGFADAMVGLAGPMGVFASPMVSAPPVGFADPTGGVAAVH